eukprot:gene5-7_t
MGDNDPTVLYDGPLVVMVNERKLSQLVEMAQEVERAI